MVAQGNRNYLIVYGEPGELAEITLAAEEKPHLQGAVRYQHFDRKNKTAIFGFPIELSSQMFLWNGKLQIVVLPRERAERTWTAERPSRAGGETLQLPVITDCALMTPGTASGNSSVISLEYAAGEHELSALTAIAPRRCLVDGIPVKLQYDPHWQSVRTSISTPQLPFQPIL